MLEALMTLRVTLEIIDGEEKKTIGTMELTLDEILSPGENNEIGNYDIDMSSDGVVEAKEGRVYAIRRKGAWSLVRRALDVCEGRGDAVAKPPVKPKKG